MNEKIRLRDNEKLLKKLSITNNIIILVSRVLIIVGLFIARYGFYEQITERADSDGSYMMIGVFGLVFTLFFATTIIFFVKLIFSFVTVIVGFSRNFNKTYSTLSIMTAIFVSINALTFMRAFLESIEKEFEIVLMVIAILIIGFSVFNDIIQWFLYRINQKKPTYKQVPDEENSFKALL